MTLYELICDTNQKMAEGKDFPEHEKREITKSLLLAVSDEATVKRFHRGVRAMGDAKHMYPLFYIPPYNNGKKLRLFTGELPKTHILAANHYELEALRILALWDGGNPAVQNMLDKTLSRLKKTCFGRFCPTGECVGAGVSALRFLSAAAPRDSEWINQILTPLIKLYLSSSNGMAATNTNIPVFYMYSAITGLAEIANTQCRELIEAKKDWLIHMLTRGKVTSPASGDTYNVIRLYVLRNALAILPEFKYMKSRPVYISEKDNRCYCDIHERLFV